MAALIKSSLAERHSIKAHKTVGKDWWCTATPYLSSSLECTNNVLNAVINK